MDTTRKPLRLFRARRERGAAIALSALFAVGCAVAAQSTQTAAPPAIVVLGLPAMPESTMSLTRRALGEIGGTLQAVQWRPTTAVLTSRFTRNRRGAGMAEIAVVATVARSVRDSVSPMTLVELRAWAMDSMAVRRTLGAAIESPSTRVHRPRPITFADSADWQSVEIVMRSLAQHGARRVR